MNLTIFQDILIDLIDLDPLWGFQMFQSNNRKK